MNRLLSCPQWLLHSGMSGDWRVGEEQDDNRDNGDSKILALQFPFLEPHCLRAEGRLCCTAQWHSFTMVQKKKHTFRGNYRGWALKRIHPQHMHSWKK